MTSAASSSQGLSPRVRGNLGDADVRIGAGGSIPACAGEPTSFSAVRHGRRVYPRVCGGTQATPQEGAISPGLSPRVRGNPHSGEAERAVKWSIPACAGEPWRGRRPGTPPRVYPRVCGGTVCLLAHVVSFPGLSPRVRGNRSSAPSAASRGRSIPACAGEPCPPVRAGRAGRVYPRVCGGTQPPSARIGRRQGLSPRVRGNRRRLAHAAAAQGSIPACAGEPRRPQRHPGRRRVYPRVCGGTAMR